MACNERTLRDYALPSLDMVQESIMRLGHSNQHLKRFLQLCDTFKYNDVTDEAIHLRLFPFSLIDNSFSWLDSQALGSIMTWDELAGKFLQKYFPISDAVQIRREIVLL
ncbi:RING-H2 finger protein ATL63 [Gossypium australe]|uniref:RING-H2 finger protein ATL63 n=1 Tax=Gossypium australe TaxID=47621 RepID=A0A5B6X2G8_9ROSI|nr:RING-H2 finger protein ATL63 [Gossypium australe]